MATKRNAISVLIRLLGGAEMTDELKKLGATGEAALEEIQTAANKVDLAKLGRSFDKLGRDLSTVGRRVGLVFAGITTAAAAATPAIIGLANAGANAADEVTRAAAAAGLQTDQFQKLAFAAEKAGTAQEAFAGGMANFNKEIADSAEKAGKAVAKLGADIQQGAGFTRQSFDRIGVTVTRFGDSVESAGKKAKKGADDTRTAFEKLGVSIRDAAGNLKTPEKLILEVADAFAKLPDGALKSAIGVELFGDAFIDMLPFLNQGAEGMRRYMDEAERLNVPFTDEELAAADRYNKALLELGSTARRLRNQVGLIFTPALTQAAQAFQKMITDNRDAVLAFANGAVKTATVFVKDLIAALVGRDQDVENKWIVEWRDAIVQFGTDVTAVVNNVVIPAFELLRGAAQLVADGFNAIFGTEATAGQVALTAAIVGLVGGFTALGAAVGVVGAGIGALVTAVGGVPVAVGAAFLAGAAAAALFYDEIVAAADATWNALVEGARLIWSDITGLFDAGASAVASAFNATVAGVKSAFDSVVAGIGAAFQRLSNLIGGIVNSIASAIKSTIGSAIDFISRQINRLISAARTAAKAIRSAVGGGGGSSDKSSGFARGGRVYGPGTATSDSIPARLSVGEYVVRAKAVEHYGPGLFAALNSLRLPEDFLDGIRRFSVGGLVDGINRSMTAGLSIPRFAEGGLVLAGGGRPFSLTLPNGETVSGMTIQPDAVTQLMQFARLEAISSAGRKPRRY